MLKDDAKAGQQAGTSIATAVAAGIAAILLSYARVLPSLLPDQIGKEELSRLWTPEGMRALFHKMSAPVGEGIRLVNPVRFWMDYPTDAKRSFAIAEALRRKRE